jgi:organic hydroperoxide reductase OsmC/OhrA
MMGTLAAALAKRGIRSHEEVYRADINGDIEEVNGILKITRIRVDYHLRIPEDKKRDAQDAFEAYLSQCPAAQSVIGCIDIQHQLRIEGQ